MKRLSSVLVCVQALGTLAATDAPRVVPATRWCTRVPRPT